MTEPHLKSSLLFKALGLISDVVNHLPFRILTTNEKKRIAGHLFPRDLELVQELAFALGHCPELFPDIALTSAELHEDDRTAAAWLGISQVLLTAGSLAHDNYVQVMSAAVVKSKAATMDVVDSYNRRARTPHLLHDRRLDLFATAILAIQGDIEARQQKRQETLVRKKAAEKGAPETAANPQARDKAEAKRARQKKAEQKASLLAWPSAWAGPSINRPWNWPPATTRSRRPRRPSRPRPRKHRPQPPARPASPSGRPPSHKPT